MADTQKPDNWASKPESDIFEHCQKQYRAIQDAYKNRETSDAQIEDYWRIYNAELDDNQVYQGNTKNYIPVCSDAINARAKRVIKQLFPNKYNHVDAVGSDGQKPYSELALLEHYIRQTDLKSICRSMLVAGDVTGQWNIYIDWRRDEKNIIRAIRKNPINDELAVEDEPEEKEETLVTQGVELSDFATEDLVVIPPTVDHIEKAEITCVKLRMSKDAVKAMVEAGTFILPEDSDIGAWVSSHKGKEKRNPDKKRTEGAGIKTEGTYKYALIYEAHMLIEFEKGKKSLGYVYYSGENEVIGIIKAPQWGQKRPFLSAPVERVQGSFNGISRLERVKFLQWSLNDFWNMGQDSGMYSMLPITMTDPEKNPNYAMMVIGLAAVWPTDPNSTKFASFPPLWKDAVGMVQAIQAMIYSSLDVNDMMMGRAPQGRKNNAMVGAQMQEGSVSVTDHAERFEEVILNPLMERVFEYDAQFRDDTLEVITYGEIGAGVVMREIPVQQWGKRYYFQWSGTDFVMNMQRMQQQIATMNVLRGIPPQQLNGRKLDISPILEILVQNVFGSELTTRILIDERNKYSVPPDMENEMMVNGIVPDIHEGDDDQEHIQSHQAAGMSTQDPNGIIRTHIEAHMQQLMVKRQKAMGEMQQQGGMPGVPGGAAPGVAGTPRPGAIPQIPRPGQQPPGAIQQDQMLGAQGRG